MKSKWTYDKCKEIALQFTTRKELKEANYQVHYKIYRKKWYELLSHMERKASKTSRCVYCYRFKTNAIYVGLTCDHKRRDIQHKQNGPVYEYSVKSKLQIPEMILLTGYIDYRDAAKIESEIIDRLLASSKNIVILNRERGGGLGSWASEKITKEKCIEDIKKCSNKTDLRKNFYPSYLYLKTHLEEIGEEYKQFFLDNNRLSRIVSFTSDGNIYKEFDSVSAAIRECGSKQVSEACREHYYTNGYYFMYYNEWVKNGKPVKVLSQKEKNEISHKMTIIHRNEKYAINGNPQKGKKRSIEQRKKTSIPIVMADLNNNFVDVLYGISFAIEKYNIPKEIGKCLYRIKNNQTKSAYGYRWYTIDYYNKTFNKNIKL